METATATLSNYRQSPRKVRLVANLLRGKSLARAKREVAVLDKRAAPTIAKLIDSAAANAKAKGIDGDLIVKNLTVDKGMVLKRMMPRAHGRGFPIKKRTSHITVTLAQSSVIGHQSSAKKEEKTTTKTTTKKIATKSSAAAKKAKPSA